MQSSRFIIIFLGFIFLIVVILTSGKIGTFLRDKTKRFFPSVVKTEKQVSPTPTVTPRIVSRVTPTTIYPRLTSTSTSNGQIPSTGPAAIVWILLPGSLSSGIVLKKLSDKITWQKK